MVIGDDGIAMTSPELTVTPSEARLDEPISILASGFEPETTVTLSLSERGESIEWRCEATFSADDSGTVDPSKHAPDGGAYDGVRPMGLFQFADGERAIDGTADRRTATITARVDGDQVATADVERVLCPPTVTVEEIDRPDLVGTLAVPPGDPPHPGVVVIGGATGGIPWGVRAKLLASHGFAVLSIAYLHTHDLPNRLADIPLEYFEDAIEWFRTEPRVQTEPVGLLCSSRGTEAGLLVASRLDAIEVVVAYAPTGYVLPAPTKDGGPAWTVDNEPIDHVESVPSRTYLSHATKRKVGAGSLDLAPIHRKMIDRADEQTLEAATIPVESIGGRILLFSGADDDLFPGARLATAIEDRLRAHEYDYPFEHIRYEDAGHALSAPYQSTNRTISDEKGMLGLPFRFGGTPAGYADADVDSWNRVLTALRSTLRLDATIESAHTE